jgi:uncharacterized sporulation protein YeaH/YhbH (DUF444 family)
MIPKIEQDLQRFKQIIRGKIKKDLKKFITSSELIGKKGKELISIPLPHIDIPHFSYGDKQKGGVAQGDGKDGEPVAPGEGGGEAGNLPGQHRAKGSSGSRQSKTPLYKHSDGGPRVLAAPQKDLSSGAASPIDDGAI